MDHEPAAAQIPVRAVHALPQVLDARGILPDYELSE
jgi:hypothetical protein